MSNYWDRDEMGIMIRTVNSCFTLAELALQRVPFCFADENGGGSFVTNFMKFGIRGQLTDVITCVKFLVDRFRGYGVLRPPILSFPIDLLRRPYNSVRTAVRHCDYCTVTTVMVVY